MRCRRTGPSGWPEEEFFTFTGTKREDHYQRYTAVILLVTAADGAAAHHTKWPDAHWPEQIKDAMRLDGLLHQVWRDHPHYYRLDNEGRDWKAKHALLVPFWNSMMQSRSWIGCL